MAGKEVSNIILLQVQDRSIDTEHRKTACFKIVKVNRESNLLYIKTTKTSNEIPIEASASLGIVFCTGKKQNHQYVAGYYYTYSIKPYTNNTTFIKNIQGASSEDSTQYLVCNEALTDVIKNMHLDPNPLNDYITGVAVWQSQQESNARDAALKNQQEADKIAQYKRFGPETYARGHSGGSKSKKVKKSRKSRKSRKSIKNRKTKYSKK